MLLDFLLGEIALVDDDLPVLYFLLKDHGLLGIMLPLLIQLLVFFSEVFDLLPPDSLLLLVFSLDLALSVVDELPVSGLNHLFNGEDVGFCHSEHVVVLSSDPLLFHSSEVIGLGETVGALELPANPVKQLR